jgi:hypothetical protein
MRSALRRLVLVALSFAGVALVQTWPLPLHLSTHVTGIVGGDAAVYLWNPWVFRHELVEQARSPFWTSTILTLDNPTGLALHNYTIFSNLLALPLQPLVGVVASFNVVYIVNVALAGIGMFLLARRVTGRFGESWIAGAVFACSPFLVARGAAHFSLAAAAPLPFFLYWFDRAWSGGRSVDAALAGAAVAWAAYCDPYYAVYCVLLASVYVSSQVLTVTRRTDPAESGGWRRLLDAAIVGVVVLVLVVHVLARGAVTIGPATVAVRTLYTPMLLLTLLVAIRIASRLRVSVGWKTRPAPTLRSAVVLVCSAVVLLVPELAAVTRLASADGLVTAPVLWRSSAPGVDLVSFFIPNPMHPLTPAAVARWLAAQPGRFEENVVSLSLVALGTIVAAYRWAGFRPAPLWIAVTTGFASLAIGPFLTVAGIPTYLPTPWTFLRYLPLIGEARMPQRFGIVVFLGVSVLLAGALAAISRRFPLRRRAMLSAVGLALTVELCPLPRSLFAADVPDIYRVVAANPAPVRLVELPFGLRDGLSSLGDYSPISQFYQTFHGKGLVGGYLSRVSERTKARYREIPVTRALMDLSEGRLPTADELREAARAGPAFVSDSGLGYVVIDTGRASKALQAFAIDALALERVDASGPLELYATRLVK